MNISEIILPAGEYYIGDPSYMFEDHDEWMKFIEEAIKPDPYDQIYKNKQVFTHGTAYGDGVYFDQFGNEYPVDSGTIGAIPKELATKTDDKLNLLIEFDKDFDCSYENGKFIIGEIEIVTGDAIDDEDDLYNSMDDDDDENWI